MRRLLIVAAIAAALIDVPAFATENVNSSAYPLGSNTMFPARGLFGGGDGALRVHAIDGKVVHAKGRNEIAPGQRMRIVEAGGAGFGDPKARAPSAIAEDVAQGYVSATMARQRYGLG